MKTHSSAAHLGCCLGLAALLGLGAIYPYLPGEYDALAVTVSSAIQFSGAVGLLSLTPVSLLWLAHSVWRHARTAKNRPAANWDRRFFQTLLGAATVVALLGSSIAVLAGSKILGCVAGAFALWLLRQLAQSVKPAASGEHVGLHPLIGYFIVLPSVAALLPWLFSGPLTATSRDRAIRAAMPVIEEIERHRADHGSYPRSLLGLHQDYQTGVVGVEKFHYAPDTEAYNLFFEQPRFLFDQLGTRELVVFHPLDQHVVVSHASWNARWSPGRLAENQGWFTSHPTKTPHWKYFWFD